MQLQPSGVRAPNPTPRRRGPRGVQLEEVAQAADALLARGLKPTIERVRQHLGGGSPNTISPLLDDWYVALSARVAGVAVPLEDDLPTDLRSAWQQAKHEARTLANQEVQEARTGLAEGRAALEAEAVALVAREEQWAASKAAIEQALTQTREASAALRLELASAQKDLADLRRRTALELDQLREALTEANRRQGVLYDEHTRALEARESAWHVERERLQARETTHERRFLAEVDQARQSAKALEAELAKEKARRVQLEDAAGVERASLRIALEEGQRVERALREELQVQAVALSRAQALGLGLEERLSAAGRQLVEEQSAHGAARTALAQAIAAVGQQASKRSVKRGSGPG